MSNKEAGKKKVTTKMLLTCLLAVVVIWGANQLLGISGGGDELPSVVNGGQRAETSAEKNERYVKEEFLNAARKNAVENLQEGPSEGLSKLPEDNLELAAEITSCSEIKIYKSQFIVSYNMTTRCPNYVCWELTADRTRGSVERTDTFSGDPVIPAAARVETFDYSRSGYDRGHLCPAGDNKNSEQAMRESFFMTNVCPQAHKLNKGDWNELENLCRSWARNYGSVYIACGPIFDKKHPKKIGNRKGMEISVPDRFFKVIFTAGKQPKAIGFIMPNDDVDNDLRDYAVSVDEVEKITGFDFFYQLPDDLEKKVEAECKPAAWGI